VKLLASFLSNPNTKDIAILQIQEWMSDSNAANNSTLQLVAAIIHTQDGNIKEAIKAISNKSNIEQ